MNLVKELDRKDLVLAVWAAEFTRSLAEITPPHGEEVSGIGLHHLASQAAQSADRAVEALRLHIEVTFRSTRHDDRLMTWDTFVARYHDFQRFPPVDGHGELATATHVSNIHVLSSDALNPRYARPHWATHVCWYNK